MYEEVSQCRAMPECMVYLFVLCTLIERPQLGWVYALSGVICRRLFHNGRTVYQLYQCLTNNNSNVLAVLEKQRRSRRFLFSIRTCFLCRLLLVSLLLQRATQGVTASYLLCGANCTLVTLAETNMPHLYAKLRDTSVGGGDSADGISVDPLVVFRRAAPQLQCSDWVTACRWRLSGRWLVLTLASNCLLSCAVHFSLWIGAGTIKCISMLCSARYGRYRSGCSEQWSW